MNNQKFPRSERLSGRADLEKVRKEGRRRVLPELVLFFLPSPSDRRIAITATRTVGNSVCRHRHVRKVRELYRLNKERWPQAGDILIVLRRSVADWAEFEIRFFTLISSLQ